VTSFEPAPPQPVRLALPLTRPQLVWGLMGINAAVFIAEMLLGGSENSQTLVTLGAKVNALIVMGEYWRLVTPMFLHIGLAHILVNSYALYALGPYVEATFSRARFLTIYVLSGVSGNVLSFAFTPNLSAGASTAIFGLVGTQLAFFYRQRKAFGSFGQARLMNILGVVAINVLFGVANQGVDNFGHLGGFIGGVTLGWLLCPDYTVEYRLDGQPHLTDQNSLRRRLPGVALFIALLAAAAGVTTLVQANSPQVQLERGIAALDHGDYAGALPLLEQAARQAPSDPEAQYMLAACYFNLRRYTEAVPFFEATLQIAPDFADAHFYLALSYAQSGRRTDAVTHLRRYLVLAPADEKTDRAQQLLAQLE